MYGIWRACERFNILPPNIENKWEECSIDAQCDLLAYDSVRSLEDAELEAAKMKARIF